MSSVPEPSLRILPNDESAGAITAGITVWAMLEEEVTLEIDVV